MRTTWQFAVWLRAARVKTQWPSAIPRFPYCPGSSPAALSSQIYLEPPTPPLPPSQWASLPLPPTSLLKPPACSVPLGGRHLQPLLRPGVGVLLKVCLLAHHTVSYIPRIPRSPPSHPAEAPTLLLLTLSLWSSLCQHIDHSLLAHLPTAISGPQRLLPLPEVSPTIF